MYYVHIPKTKSLGIKQYNYRSFIVYDVVDLWHFTVTLPRPLHINV